MKLVIITVTTATGMLRHSSAASRRLKTRSRVAGRTHRGLRGAGFLDSVFGAARNFLKSDAAKSIISKGAEALPGLLDQGIGAVQSRMKRGKGISGGAAVGAAVSDSPALAAKRRATLRNLVAF